MISEKLIFLPVFLMHTIRKTEYQKKKNQYSHPNIKVSTLPFLIDNIF